jgi:DNA invertase Pin-like site-specific DNA recombinase
MARARKRAAVGLVEGARVVGYLRCSTQEQADSGLGIEAQKRAIEAEADARGWVVVTFLSDLGVSGKSTRNREAFAAAMAMIEAGGADVLVASKVDRLARSLKDFCELLDRAARNGWALLALDAPFDATTPSGRAMLQVLGVFAELERRLISARVKDALAVKKSEGVQLGRPKVVAEAVVTRIVRERDSGRSLPNIAAGLNTDAIQTAHGGQRWYPSTVRAVYLSAKERAAA